MGENPAPWSIPGSNRATPNSLDAAADSVRSWLNPDTSAGSGGYSSARATCSALFRGESQIGGGGNSSRVEADSPRGTPLAAPPHSESSSPWLREGIVQIADFVTSLGRTLPKDSVDAPQQVVASSSSPPPPTAKARAPLPNPGDAVKRAGFAEVVANTATVPAAHRSGSSDRSSSPGLDPPRIKKKLLPPMTNVQAAAPLAHAANGDSDPRSDPRQSSDDDGTNERVDSEDLDLLDEMLHDPTTSAELRELLKTRDPDQEVETEAEAEAEAEAEDQQQQQRTAPKRTRRPSFSDCFPDSPPHRAVDDETCMLASPVSSPFSVSPVTAPVHRKSGAAVLRAPELLVLEGTSPLATPRRGSGTRRGSCMNIKGGNRRGSTVSFHDAEAVGADGQMFNTLDDDVREYGDQQKRVGRGSECGSQFFSRVSNDGSGREDSFGEFESWDCDDTEACVSDENEWDEPQVSWERLEQDVATFCFETGGGHGTWLRSGDGQSFGLGVEQMLGSSPADVGGSDIDRDAPPEPAPQPDGPSSVGGMPSGVRITMPAGFAEGRDVRHLRQDPKRKQGPQTWDRLLRVPFARAVAFGRISWDSMEEPANFIRCSTRSSEAVLPHLLRFFAESVWGLKRPGMIISCVGTASDLDLRPVHLRKLRGVMTAAVETGAWVTTGGFDGGVSKMMAQFRKEADNKVPLVGFVPWGMVEGRHALWEPEADGRVAPHVEKLPLEDFQTHEKHFHAVCGSRVRGMRVNRQHSHLFLIDDGTFGTFGNEVKCRAAFETAVCDITDDEGMQSRIRNTLRATNLGWQMAHMRPTKSNAKTKTASRGAGSAIPSVGICIGGSNTTVSRVSEMVKRGTPVLLVKGTSGTTDLVADLVYMIRQTSEGGSEKGSFWRTASGRSGGWADSFLMDAAESENEKFHLPEEKFQLIAKLLARKDGLSDVQLEDDINTIYQMRYPVKDIGNLLSVARSLAPSLLCQVFDIDRNEDLPGAMLLAVLHKQMNEGLEWKDCLQLIVSWNHVNIMQRTLERVGKVTVHTRRAVEAAFHLAFKRNKAPMAYCLLEHLDCTNTYNIHGDMSSLFGAALATVKKKRVNQTKAVARWGDLVGKALKELHEELGGALALERWSELYDLALRDEEVRKLMGKSRHYHYTSPQAAARNKPFGESLDGTRRLSAVQVTVVQSKWRRGSTQARATQAAGGVVSGEMECKRMLKELEGVYKKLLGEQFWHETSAWKPVLDLFLWSLLMRRKPMAKMLWARMDIPVRTMLTAAAMYRAWVVKATDLKAHTKEALLADALEFEEVAVSVQTALMRLDSDIALACCELPSLQWKGLSAVDVSILGGCEHYVEHCCGEALDFRWTGDMHPYDQPFGLYPTVLLCLLSCGLLVPTLIVFRPPPRAEALRAPAQSRAIPTGHHERQRTVEPYTDVDTAMNQRNLWLRLQDKNQTGSSSVFLPDEDGEAELGDEDAMGWFEQLRLFASAPVTIFMVDALQQLVFNTIFTRLLISPMLPAHTLSWTEIVICWATASTNLYEIVELLLEGWQVYFSNSWNSIQLVSCGAFWLGLATKLSGVDGERLQQTRLCYAVSLFFMWTRVLYVLSVHKEVGPLVIAFSRMRRDVLLFTSIWAVLLLAFSSAMQAADPDCHAIDPEQANKNPMFGWDSWWLVRTYYQSFGEPFYEELTTDASNIIMLIMFPVMNLMLVNLLIAIMNDTYTDVKHRSKLQWMLQMYQVGKEYRSSARLNLLMLTWDVVDFWCRKAEVDARTNHLGQINDGWLADLRFKYKRFQTKDLPPVDKKDLQIKLASKIDELEAKELGSATKNVGIPGRVWMKRQVEWHHDVTALGSHQYLRKELAIRCNMRGCVAVPFQLSVDGEKPTDKDGQERGLVMLFYSSGRMNANSVDQIIRAVHSHQAEEEAGADLNSRGSDSPDAADGLTARSCSEPIADKPPGMAQRFSSAPEKGVGIGPKGPVESGGEEPAASVLKRTCQECNLTYAEAMRPTKGKMELCAHFYSGYNAQVFYKETSTSFVFPQETKEQLEADRTMEAAEVDAIKQGLKNAGWPTELRRAYLFSSTFRSSGNKKNAIAPSESSSVMSSKMSGAKSMRSDVKSEMNGGSIFRSHSILHGIRSLNGKSGTKISVSEVKRKLKDALLKLRVQAKEDQESIRNVKASLMQVQAAYAQAHSIGAYLKVDSDR